MSLRAFVVAGYALFVEGFIRLGADLVTAVERTSEALGLSEAVVREEAPTPGSDNAEQLAAMEREIAAMARRPR